MLARMFYGPRTSSLARFTKPGLTNLINWMTYFAGGRRTEFGTNLTVQSLIRMKARRIGPGGQDVFPRGEAGRRRHGQRHQPQPHFCLCSSPVLLLRHGILPSAD